MTSRNVSAIATAFVLALGVLAAPAVGRAGIYPGNKCVSAKMKDAGKHCQSVLKAWSLWDKTQDDAKRDAMLSKAATKLTAKWAKSEAKASAKGVDCADTTVTSSELGAIVGTAAGQIVSEINDGLVLGPGDDGKCGSKFLKVAAKKCAAFLKAESKHVKKLDKDPDGDRLDADKVEASAKFDEKWSSTMGLGCTAGTSAARIEELIDELSDEVVASTTISPNVSQDQFDAYTHPPSGPTHFFNYDREAMGPKCQDGSPYTFYAKRGTENKLLMYYEGGGACWNGLTCSLSLCKQDVDVVGNNPTGWSSGFFDFDNPDNPFREWHIVYVSYCSCDVHWGDNGMTYSSVLGDKHVEHRGYDNAKLAEKWAREHFVNPEEVFVTGSSAGAYGATMHGIFLHDVYPASNINVVADAGNGVITQDFLVDNFPDWGVEQHLPDLPEIAGTPTDQQSIPMWVQAAARHFPDTNWGHYTTAFDGGTGGQGGFYHVMLNDTNDLVTALTVWLNWWESSCEFNSVMRQQAQDTEAVTSGENDNYRYYIGTGSRHTGFGNNKLYTDTTGGVPTIADWVNDMIDDDPGWVSVEASPFNVLLPGDPDPPSIPTAPFEWDGPDIVVNCP